MEAAIGKKRISPRTAAFRSRVYEIVRAIPRGHVMPYGAIAAMISPPKGIDRAAYERIKARWVGYAMADCPEDVPWQRVVNSKGEISRRAGYDLLYQRHLLEAEGVLFGVGGCVDLARYGWAPPRSWLLRHSLLTPKPQGELRSQRSAGGAPGSRARRKGSA